MLIGQGGYSKVWNPPRNHSVIEQKYRNNKAYIQRLTKEEAYDITKGQLVRMIFDKNNTKSSPLLAIYKRPDGTFSEIRPYRDESIRKLLVHYKDTSSEDVRLFCHLMKGMKQMIKGLVVLHKNKWIHHDIKGDNILFNANPLRIFLVDWATSVPFDVVYDDTYSNWFYGDNANHPPEYKMYSHYRHNYKYKNNDFATDYSRNIYIISLRKIQPNYVELLSKANEVLQKEFQKNDTKFLEKIAPKVDVFAVGLVLSRIFLTLAYGTLFHTSVHKKLVNVLRHMIDPNPITRWSMKRSLSQLSPVIQEICKYTKR